MMPITSETDCRVGCLFSLKNIFFVLPVFKTFNLYKKHILQNIIGNEQPLGGPPATFREPL